MLDSKIQLSSYDGKEKNYENWKEKFEAYCLMRGYGRCLVKNG